MNLWLRLIRVALAFRRDESVSLLDPITLGIRVYPHDLDLLLHMNNGRYLALMDLGRFALMKRTGVLHRLHRQGGTALLGGIIVWYIRPLSLFQRAQLITRVLSWDDKWVYLEHRIVRGETLHARAIARVLARDAGGNIPTPRLLELAGAGEPEPPEPAPAVFERPEAGPRERPAAG